MSPVLFLFFLFFLVQPNFKLHTSERNLELTILHSPKHKECTAILTRDPERKWGRKRSFARDEAGTLACVWPCTVSSPTKRAQQIRSASLVQNLGLWDRVSSCDLNWPQIRNSPASTSWDVSVTTTHSLKCENFWTLSHKIISWKANTGRLRVQCQMSQSVNSLSSSVVSRKQ